LTPLVTDDYSTGIVTLSHRQRRPLAWIALYAVLCGCMLPLFEAHPLGLDDDAACVISAGRGQPQATRLHALPNADEGQPAHCVVCHLMRAMSGAMSSDVAALAVPFVATARHGLTDSPPPAALSEAPASRGPPASTL
jgi:hypothetical protein